MKAAIYEGKQAVSIRELPTPVCGDRIYTCPLLVTGDDTSREGTIGISAAIALKEFGCKQVMVTDLSDLRLEKAAGLGFAVCSSGNEDLKTEAIETAAQPDKALNVVINYNVDQC